MFIYVILSDEISLFPAAFMDYMVRASSSVLVLHDTGQIRFCISGYTQKYNRCVIALHCTQGALRLRASLSPTGASPRAVLSLVKREDGDSKHGAAVSPFRVAERFAPCEVVLRYGPAVR